MWAPYVKFLLLVTDLSRFFFVDDPDVPHVRHRDFLQEHVVFKEVRCMLFVISFFTIMLFKFEEGVWDCKYVEYYTMLWISFYTVR